MNNQAVDAFIDRLIEATAALEHDLKGNPERKDAMYQILGVLQEKYQALKHLLQTGTFD